MHTLLLNALSHFERNPLDAESDLAEPNADVKPATRWWLLLGMAIIAMPIALLIPTGSNEGPNSPASGKPAPRLDLIQLTGYQGWDRLEQIPSKKVVLIHFWGTWCGPCKLEYPELSQMVDRFQGDPEFQFLSVSCEYGSGETFAGLQQKTVDYLGANAAQEVAYCDPQSITRRSVAERLGRESMFYPTSVLVGHDGRIVAVWEGYVPGAVEEIEAHIQRQLQTAPE